MTVYYDTVLPVNLTALSSDEIAAPVTKKHRTLANVERFIRQLQANLAPHTSGNLRGIWFSRRDDGSLFLDEEETATYTGIVDELMKEFVPREDLTRRSVESFLQDALFSSLDIRKKRTAQTFDERLTETVKKLGAVLSAPSELFRCWLPVNGLSIGRAHASFGGVGFVRFGETQLRQITRRRSIRTPYGRGESWRRNLDLLRKSEVWGAVCAVIEVKARDSSSARGLAVRRARQVIDVLNVFTDLVPFNHGWLYMPGDAAKVLVVVPTQKHNGDFSADFRRLKPFEDVSWKGVKDAKSISTALTRLGGFLRSDHASTSCAALLLAAAQWTGRATVDRRREQSFLLYAIALETMILPTMEGELSYRLRLRVAHLLGRTPESRERIAADVSHLYGVRSRIVHSGSYEVTDEDLGRLRSIVKGCLLRLLSQRAIHSLSAKEFSGWYDRKLWR